MLTEFLSLLGCGFEGTSKLSMSQTESMSRLRSEEERKASQTWFSSTVPYLSDWHADKKARKLEVNLDMPLFLIAHIQSFMKPCFFFYLLKHSRIQSLLFSPAVGVTIFIGITLKSS